MSADSTVLCVVNREVKANTYILPTGVDGCLLIDPGLDRVAIESALERSGLRPRAIFCTHGHFDHVGTAEHFRRRYRVDIHMHPADRRIARSSNFTMMALKMPWRIDTPQATVAISEGTVWSEGGIEVNLVHVPGHTPGSVVLLIDGHAFTGDTLYRQGVWLGSMPESDHDLLRDSLQRLWGMLPADIGVYPGHGRPAVFSEIQETNKPLRELLGLPDADGAGQ